MYIYMYIHIYTCTSFLINTCKLSKDEENAHLREKPCCQDEEIPSEQGVWGVRKGVRMCQDVSSRVHRLKKDLSMNHDLVAG